MCIWKALWNSALGFGGTCLRESWSHILQQGKRKILLRIQYSKGIMILLALEMFTSFCNCKTMQANLQYVDVAHLSPAQFLLYHLWENFRAMRGRSATTGSCCVWEWMGGGIQLFIL